MSFASVNIKVSMRGIALLYKNRGVKWMILDTFKGSKKVIGVKQATKAIEVKTLLKEFLLQAMRNQEW